MKTTKKQFKIFKKECKKWINEFGLTDWEVYFTHEYKEGCRANYYSKVTGRICVFNLSTDWDFVDYENGIPKSEIKKVALHEILHLVLAPLQGCAYTRFVIENEIIEAEHSAIRRLENLLFKNS